MHSGLSGPPWFCLSGNISLAADMRAAAAHRPAEGTEHSEHSEGSETVWYGRADVGGEGVTWAARV
ncbi:MAG: hypothetical protein ACI30W_03990 [Muribaculaceae bacterium]